MKLVIQYDEATECPNEWDGWMLHSFNRRHINFTAPSEFLSPPDERGYISGVNIGMTSKLNAGTAFLLSYYEHGLGCWSLQGEGPQCRFDTTSVAGILIWDTEENGPLFKSTDPISRYEKREQSARDYCKVFTDWSNGHIYFYSLEDDSCVFDSCGGFIGEDWLKESLKNAHSNIFDEKGNLKESLNIEVTGDAAYILQ